MPEKIANVPPPSGLSRILYRLPILLFRLCLGWMFGGHLLLLNHTGRKSGLPRQVVLECIRHDKPSDTYFVIAGWGEKSDWFCNVQKTPQVTIQVGCKPLNAYAERLPLEQAELEILTYARRFHAQVGYLVRIAGYRVDGTEADYRALASVFPVVALRRRLSQ